MIMGGINEIEELFVMTEIDKGAGKLSGERMRVTSRRSRGETIDLVVEHELPGVTPEMLDWWWDNIDSTERYRLWHPQAHLAFKWERKCERHVGTVHEVTEKIGDSPATLRIRWEDPDLLPIERVYEHANAGSVLDEADEPMSWLMHQYKSIPGGTKMRSTFRLPASAPEWFIEDLRMHNIEEMGQFPSFLPELYARRDRSSTD
jgi:hypothetical protein